MANETNGCIEFEGTRSRQGYGVLPKPVHGSRLAHRAVLAAKLGRPVEGVSRHTCDNPPCVNPDHLIEGTQADNVADAVRRGRVARGQRKDTCVHGHDIKTVGRGQAGRCNACIKDYARAQAEKRRLERHARGLRRPTPIRFRKAA